ncbi:unnamed protein product [Allacma fusca]|uniref:Uncharacterized protein n=1 Tax=Allacma fusca TaxID=39272 RepID=A0A8J2NRH0_9HEXA|nr:unnamed protein product [Allacma fusca]
MHVDLKPCGGETIEAHLYTTHNHFQSDSRNKEWLELSFQQCNEILIPVKVRALEWFPLVQSVLLCPARRINNSETRKDFRIVVVTFITKCQYNSYLSIE